MVKNFFRLERLPFVSFGDWLKTTRKKSGLTQEGLVTLAVQIAGREVCSSGYVSNLERNYDVGKKRRHTQPDLFIVEALADALADQLNEPRASIRREARLAANYAAEEEISPPDGFEMSDFVRMYHRQQKLSPKKKKKAQAALEMLDHYLDRLEKEDQ